MGVKKMVGKLSRDDMLSGSRLPVLYLWKYGSGHPWSTPNNELRKSIEAKHGRFERVDTVGEPGICGNLLEKVLVQNCCEELGIPEPLCSPPVIDKSEEFYQCSLDGLTTVPAPVTVFANELVEIDGGEASIQISGPIPIECKVTSEYRRDDIPMYRGPLQLQLQMMAVGANFGILVTLYRGIERHIKIYRYDEEIAQRIKDICKEFSERVESEEPYKPVNVDDAQKAYPSADGGIELPELADRVERLVRLRQDAKELEVQIDALQTEIMSEMREAEKASVGQYQVIWPIRKYKATEERVVPAKEAREVRLKTLQIK
jgi:hypothetical protein